MNGFRLRETNLQWTQFFPNLPASYRPYGGRIGLH